MLSLSVKIVLNTLKNYLNSKLSRMLGY